MKLSRLNKYLGCALRRDPLHDLTYETLFINITSRCNSRCVYCEQHLLDHTQDLPPQRLHDLLDEAHEMGVQHVFLSGGEPLVNPHVWSLLERAYSHGTRLHLISNALLVPDLAQREMSLLEGLTDMLVSLDTHKPEEFNALRGADVFEKTVEAIKRLCSRGIEVRLNAVLSNRNYRDLEAFIRFAKQLGVQGIYFQPLRVWSNYAHADAHAKKRAYIPHEQDLEDLESSLLAALQTLKSIGLDSTLPAIAPWLRSYFQVQGQATPDNKDWIRHIVNGFLCKEVFTTLFIQHDGGLLPCAMLMPVTSVRDKPLKEAVLELEPIKALFRKGGLLPDCYKCSCQLPSNYTFSLACSPMRNIGKVVQYWRSSVVHRAGS